MSYVPKLGIAKNLSAIDLDAPAQPSISKPSFAPSEQQQSIFDWIKAGKGHLKIIARAGTGKTTTGIQGTAYMYGDVMYAAFNKAIAEEIGQKLAAQGLPGKAATFHSIGLQALTKLQGRSKISSSKTFKIFDEVDESVLPKAIQPLQKRLLSIAKQSIADPEKTPDEFWRAAIDHFDLLNEVQSAAYAEDESTNDFIDRMVDINRELLMASNAVASKFIDFDDMIYLPVLWSAQRKINPFPQYDWVFIDEAQDTNFARRKIAARMVKPNGHVIAVGDDRQAIYGFTGADSAAMELLASELNGMDTRYLTVSYRCPRQVIALAQSWVPDIQPHANSKEGAVIDIDQDTFEAFDTDILNSRTAILCRNNGPLVKIAYSLIKRSIPAKIEGRDIGQGLIKLIDKWPRVVSLEVLERHLREYVERECDRLEASRKAAQAAALEDRMDCILAIISGLPGGSTTADLRKQINDLFDDTTSRQRTVVLSTIHKAKGREWPTVILYGRNKFQPARYAKQDWELVQESNLCYVAVTRAQETLYEVHV